MTVASTTNRKSFSGDGVTTSFGTSPVVFYESTDLVVEVFSSAGVATTLTAGTQYTVSGGSTTGATGTVNLAGGTAPYGAPAVGTTLLIRRVLPLVQEADFVNNDINDAEVSETALDKLTMIAQQISETSGRGVAIPAVETATDALTVLPFDRASSFLAFDANKEMIASPGAAGVPVSTFMATVLDDADADEARTTLVAAGSGAVTGSGLTMSTARLLGRTTASTGAVEELTAGTGISLSGGALSATAASESAAGVIEIATQAEIEAGSSNLLAVTPGRFRGAMLLSRGFQSSDQTITNAGALTLAHGLGVVPKIIQVALVCQTGELGYTANDIVFVNAHTISYNNNYGQVVVPDATNLNIRFGSAGYVIMDKGTGAQALLTNGNWKARFYAWG